MLFKMRCPVCAADYRFVRKEEPIEECTACMAQGRIVRLLRNMTPPTSYTQETMDTGLSPVPVKQIAGIEEDIKKRSKS